MRCRQADAAIPREESEVRIKNWDKFQHYNPKLRRPPWIKLHRTLLTDFDFYNLDPLAAKTLVLMWLIASENNGELPSVNILAYRLRMSDKQISSIITQIYSFLESDASVPSADGKRLLPLEVEVDLEVDKNKNKDKSVTRTKTVRFTPPTLEDVSQYCQSRNNTVDPVKFHAFYSSKGWKVGRSPMKDWQACVVTWERGS